MYLMAECGAENVILTAASLLEMHNHKINNKINGTVVGCRLNYWIAVVDAGVQTLKRMVGRKEGKSKERFGSQSNLTVTFICF
jgi:hypothetical protein